MDKSPNGDTVLEAKVAGALAALREAADDLPLEENPKWEMARLLTEVRLRFMEATLPEDPDASLQEFDEAKAQCGNMDSTEDFHDLRRALIGLSDSRRPLLRADQDGMEIAACGAATALFSAFIFEKGWREFAPREQASALAALLGTIMRRMPPGAHANAIGVKITTLQLMAQGKSIAEVLEHATKEVSNVPCEAGMGTQES